MEQKRIAHLVQKWNSKEISPQEQKELEEFWEWASQDDALLNSFSEIERESTRLAMLANIRSTINSQPYREGKTIFIGRLSWPLRIAATLTIGVLAFWLLYNPIEVNEVRTAYGQQRTIALPDGSSVILNSNSSVRYKDFWNDRENREVWIDGEGFFDVTHTQNHQKFIVHTINKVDVQVLGTRFNVKRRRDKTEVMLEQGNVQVNIELSGMPDTIALEPGNLVTLEKQVFIKSLVNPSNYSSWKDKKLYFDQTPLFEVAKIIEDTHGFQIEFKDKSLRNRKLSGEIQSGKVEDILLALRESLQIQITKEGNKLFFY
jgi:transmembrane sensor